MDHFKKRLEIINPENFTRILFCRAQRFDDFFKLMVGTGRFGNDVSAKTKLETFRLIFHAKTSVSSWSRIILVLFLIFYKLVRSSLWNTSLKNSGTEKNDKIINVGNMESIKRASDMSPFPLVPRGSLGPLTFPSC